MDPPLGVDDICDGSAGAAYGISLGIELGNQGVDFALVRYQELDVITAGPTQVSIAELIRDICEQAQGFNTGDTRGGGTDGEGT